VNAKLGKVMSYGFLMDRGHREIAFKNQAEILADDFM
jgi:hypothetical protein